MKKTTLLFISILAFTVIKAQDSYQNDQIRTVFSGNKSNGGYGAFTMSYSNIGGYDALVTGGRGAFIFDHVLAIGLGGYGFVNNLDYNYHNPGSSSTNRNLSLAGGYGGLLIEPIVAGKSPVHVAFPILIGGGGVTLVDVYGWDYWGNPYPGNEYAYDAFFVIEPAVELEFNLARFFRLAAAVSYRYTSDINLYRTDLVDTKQTSENALHGLNFGLTFKFGKF
jgi:hypothetical protein